jgi:hypothetical protein
MAKSKSQGAKRHARSYRKNVLTDKLKDWAVWLPLNARYAAIYIVSGGGRLAKVPKRSEVPLVSVLLLTWGILSIGSLLFRDYSFFGWWVALGITGAYIVGGYLLFMEQPGATQIAGFALAADLILFPDDTFMGLFRQAIKLLLFAIFLLVCVKDWRVLVTLPDPPGENKGGFFGKKKKK